ncbi:cytochrome P450 CYP12A2 isoform X1 [Plutella xylostella]|uniref:cytochrome P450 CYP12A2 isoform X1 n=1 Tax=Plutella xylostella TaxID=51655 RepID=UPI002032933C|nr:cytochrome P450 CYP12A2 isoform X1 [Plutella xylostella]
MPGLSKLPVIGALHHFLPVVGSIGHIENFFNLYGHFHKKYGSFVKMEGILSRPPMVIMFEPEHYDQVYRVEEENPLRPGFDTIVYYREVLQKSTFDGVYGLTTAQGEKWRDFRTKVNPALLKLKLLKVYAPGIEEIATEFVERLKKTKEDPVYLQNHLYDEMSKYALEAVGFVGLGARLGTLSEDLTDDHPARRLQTSVKDIFDLAIRIEARPKFMKHLPTAPYRKILAACDTQWEISSMYIEQARNTIKNRGHEIPEEDKSIIEKLLAIDEKVAVMMANEMLLAGIDTVSFVTVGLLYHLATNPQAQDRVREEVRSSGTSRRYLKACLKESLRIWPVIPANLRRTTREHVVGGYLLPKGVEVIAPNEFLSKQEKYYPRPLEFIPERWLADKADPLYYGNAHPMVTLPFGFGVRSCIGRRIAELEIEILTSAIVDNFVVSWHGPPIKVKTTIMNLFQKPYNFEFESVK